MEIYALVISMLLIPLVVVGMIFFLWRRYYKETEKNDRLVNTLENVIEMKNTIIRHLKGMVKF